MKYLGIDYGTKKIGVATSDDSGVIAFPHSIILYNEDSLSAIIKLVSDEHIDCIVMGDSLTGTRNENPVMISARRFAKALKERILVPMYWMNEFGTTASVLQSHVAMSGQRSDQASKAPRHGGVNIPVDDQAAAIMLQRYLDSVR
ncbi:hypothetical protein A2997_02445 [Candidatus Nomurabacteria bacterium RIFCSPLOWO2_01_FULL_36_10b]|uniref:Putative pre-16S rRNA nuclease n=1 Tax=Candidatus Nomurabacteria bacterium RIFCSPLOWO2_01_FULL_36_10b TaxID=1801766 RepID=A0A1F6WP48_9BACT|nr:MAG: hypothetical protein A2997_02445 [Candidatus Nomurabacteria bacterium RIFCSPLOWO2_01_FULL_36_10b]